MARPKQLLACSELPDFAKINSWVTDFAGTPLNLTGATLTFSDEFTSLSVTDDDGAGPWYAPVQPDYGLSHFLPPSSPNTPFSQSGSELTITQKYVSGEWISGTMQTMNSSGEGFAQTYGYFEANMKNASNEVGAWPAFWLLSQNSILNPAAGYAEVDIMEAYGGSSPNDLHCSIHKWPIHFGVSLVTDVGTSLFNNSYHKYGVLINSDWIIAYFDRLEVGRYATYELARQPMYMILSLALYTSPLSTDDMSTVIDYVKAYSF